MKLKNRYMLDIETLGTRPGSVIFEIGCVRFDEARILAEFSVTINVADAKRAGLVEDNATALWWAKQSREAQSVLLAAQQGGGSSLADALASLAAFLSEGGTEADEVWGNGSDFDNALVAEAYRRIGYLAPWRYARSRCLRTASAKLPPVEIESVGVHHRALDDARYQALKLLAMEAAARSVIAGLTAVAPVVHARSDIRRIYLASPYSHPSKDIIRERVRRVRVATAIINERGGINCYSPIAHGHDLPHPEHIAKDDAFWKPFNEDEIRRSDEVWVLTLNGWDISKGVTREIEYAKQVGKPVRFVDHDALFIEHMEGAVS